MTGSMLTLAAAAAGAAGAVARFGVDAGVRAHWASSFPWATLGINVSGSLLLGALTGLVLFHGDPAMVKTVAGTGFLGGYTTFSTASFETVRLLQGARMRAAVANAAGTLVLSAAAAAAGLGLAAVG